MARFLRFFLSLSFDMMNIENEPIISTVKVKKYMMVDCKRKVRLFFNVLKYSFGMMRMRMSENISMPRKNSENEYNVVLRKFFGFTIITSTESFFVNTKCL